MKIAIDPGHNLRNDVGAFGLQSEDKLIMNVTNRVIAQLISLGHEVVNCLPTFANSNGHSLRQRVAIANNSRADIFASIHFNAFYGKGYGTEVFATSPSGKAIAKRVVNNIAGLGFKNRGVKTANFYVIKYTSMPAVLIECCFCDSRRDMNLFDPQEMAIAITEGLTNQSVIVDDDKMTGTIIVTEQTYLKPSTDQISQMDREEKNQLIKLQPGQYAVELITEEEGHYFADFVNRPGDDTSFFVSMAHSKIKLG